jgi:hypothetical protein
MADLNIRQRKLIKLTVEGKKRKEAGIEAGFSPKTAESQASQTLAKPNVREAFLAAMDKAGITDDRLAKVMDEGLKANRAVVGTDATGKTMDFMDVPDHSTRHKFFDSATKIKGLEAAKKIEAHHSFDDLIDDLDDGESPADTEED